RARDRALRHHARPGHRVRRARPFAGQGRPRHLLDVRRAQGCGRPRLSARQRPRRPQGVMAETDVREVLTRGELTVKGRLPWSSNATFLVEAALDDATALGVYKPERGERPLWDFPPGLFRRELAAWHLSEALDWGLVPLTVRRDGPYGEGSLQEFVQADFTQHYFTLCENTAHRDRLARICAFD